jgi:hypothetical protein
MGFCPGVSHSDANISQIAIGGRYLNNCTKGGKYALHSAVQNVTINATCTGVHIDDYTNERGCQSKPTAHFKPLMENQRSNHSSNGNQDDSECAINFESIQRSTQEENAVFNIIQSYSRKHAQITLVSNRFIFK